MPRCKYCGSRIARFDKDICPICGEKEPLKGVSSETVEITSELNLSEEELKTFKPKTKFKTLMVFSFLGWTGLAQFYLGYIMQGFCWLILNLAILGGGFSALYYLTNLGLILSIVLPVVFVYIFNICFGIFSFLKHNLRDHTGEFLR